MKFTIEADNLDQMIEVAQALLTIRRPSQPPTEPSAADSPDGDRRWQGFFRARSGNQPVAITLLQRHRGRITLRALESESGVPGKSLSGTISSLNKASRRSFGQALIEPEPWYINDKDRWDREYVLNTDIAPLDESLN